MQGYTELLISYEVSLLGALYLVMLVLILLYQPVRGTYAQLDNQGVPVGPQSVLCASSVACRDYFSR